MLNDNHAGILLASKANKKKAERLQFLSILAAACLILIFGLFIFLTSDDGVDPKDHIAEERHLTQHDRISVEAFPEKKNQSFDDLSRSYIEDIKPALQTLPVQTIFGKKAVAIIGRLDILFEQAKKDTVIESELDNEIVNAQAFLKKYQDEFRSALKRLQVAFERHNASDFERELTSLLVLAENNEEVTKWLHKKDKILEYFGYANKANRARSELKIEVELAALREIDRLGFADSRSLTRIDELQNIVTEQRFANHVRYTNTLIAEAKFKKAKEELSKAAAIFPLRPQVEELRSYIAKEIKKINAADMLRVADKYATLDQWHSANESYAKALAIMSNSKLAIDGYQLSKTILSLNAQLKDIINRPLRLKSMEVMEYAKQLLTKSALYTQYSMSLAHLHIKADELVEEKMLPRSVWMESDATANIRVQGVGYIKPTKGKFINITPGEYLFYAECKGRKTQIYKVTIPLEGEILPIRVICGVSL